MIPNKVLLVGAIGLPTVNDVFKTVGEVLGKRIKRIPDGEPGGRRQWVMWQFPLLFVNPLLTVNKNPPPNALPMPVAFIRLADGVKPGELEFGELGYAREFRASYEDFVRARKANQFRADVKFQVTLPTPFAVVTTFCPGKDLTEIEKAYERAMHEEVRTICNEIPHNDLCIQWDVCQEVLIYDGQFEGFTPEHFISREPETDLMPNELMPRMMRLCSWIPDDVELGIHLCYGDYMAKHSAEPVDLGKAVSFANKLAATVAHPLAYVHMPVPIDRHDDSYFKPLKNLALAPATELYLGVIHSEDGADGANKRIAAAAKYADDFGIATECGMGRCKTPAVVVSMLKTHAAVTRA